MTWWRVATAARSSRVALEGFYGGSSAFLIGGSPRLLKLDLRLLKLPGIYTMAINNASVVIEPQAFIALDTSKCFNPNIFLNPRVMKMFTYSRHDEIVGGKRLCTYPNTVFFDVQDETQLMMSEFCKLEGPLPYWRVTFFTALAALYQLGFMNVYLLGCTFDAPGYAHGHQQRDVDRAFNENVHEETIEYLKSLMPLLRDEGMKVVTCHQNTALDGICDYVSYHDAVSEVCLGANPFEFQRLWHPNELRQ